VGQKIDMYLDGLVRGGAPYAFILSGDALYYTSTPSDDCASAISSLVRMDDFLHLIRLSLTFWWWW
jgi:hypothetical protein